VRKLKTEPNIKNKNMKKIIALLIFLQSFGLVFAQDKNEISVNFNHFALSVKDADQSAKFYKSVLNLDEITNRTIIDGIRWLSLGEGKELHLISILKDEIKINKAVHLALTTSDFDLLIAKLQSMEIEYSDWPGNVNKINVRPDGIKQVFFQDPNGYWIEVNSVGQNTD
jgi:catechol 2,3-dioxygenase-like lactoylglutathione lyase family enzyme